MSEVVFILGAGASHQCGAPVMNNFLDVARDLYSKHSIPKHKRQHFDRVFNAIGALQQVHSKAQLDIHNIESVFTALEVAKLIGKLPGYRTKEIPDVIASLKELIVVTLEQTIKFNKDKMAVRAPEEYDSFVRLLDEIKNKAHPHQTVAIITFNYDVAVDFALIDRHMTPLYFLANDSRNKWGRSRIVLY